MSTLIKDTARSSTSNKAAVAMGGLLSEQAAREFPVTAPDMLSGTVLGMTETAAEMPGRTLPLTVRNTGFLLDRLGEDCSPLQFLRELTQNAIEAIGRTKGTGEVVWDVDWMEYELSEHPVFKLSVTDNGDGMTGEEMVRYINALSSSLTVQSVGGNYGVGAKIAAATRNHAGLVYLSWKGGKGSMIHLWRDPATGQYGLRQLRRPDGTFGHHAEVDPAVKPEGIGDHGTKIILYGQTPVTDTMKAPAGSVTPSRWIAKYLNTRYFRLPEGITIKAREGWEYPRSDKNRNILRRVMGQGEYLGEHSTASGTVGVKGAVVYWWILKDAPALANSFVEASGHVAALHKEELYEMATGRAGRAKVQSFGVLLGHNRVVIYVEPNVIGDRKVTTNTARTQLLVDGLSLPWEDWAEEFRKKMPKEIEDLMAEVAAGATSANHSQSIRDRLKQILDLYRVSRYHLVPSGSVKASDAESFRGGAPPSGDSDGDPTGEAREDAGSDTAEPRPVKEKAPKVGEAGGVYASFLKADGAPADLVYPEVFPETRWVSVKDHTREPGDMEDRAARYLADQNVLLINEDFRAFVDMVDRWHKEFGGSAGIREVIKDAVHTWFEQSLVEATIGVQALKGSKEWTSKHVEAALSEEALTVAVMLRYHVNNAVRRELGVKLGKLGVTSTNEGATT
jgi:hypothetical protein